MSVRISTRVDGGFGVLELKGKLTLSPQLQQVREEARKVVTAGAVRGLILLVSEITSVDSAGIGELTVVYSLCARRECGMELVGVNPAFRKILEITRLDAVLSASPDIESAKSRLLANAGG